MFHDHVCIVRLLHVCIVDHYSLSKSRIDLRRSRTSVTSCAITTCTLSSVALRVAQKARWEAKLQSCCLLRKKSGEDKSCWEPPRSLRPRLGFQVCRLHISVLSADAAACRNRPCDPASCSSIQLIRLCCCAAVRRSLCGHNSRSKSIESRSQVGRRRILSELSPSLSTGPGRSIHVYLWPG